MGTNSSFGVDFIKMKPNLQIQEFDIIPIELQTTDKKIEFQDIEYSMINTGKSVSYFEHKQIDLQTALNETKNLDWTFLDNGISIINNKTDDCIFFRRVALDRWYVDTPIRLPRFAGLVWASYIDENSADAILKLFFEENDWFYATSWHEAPDLFEAVSELKK